MNITEKMETLNGFFNEGSKGWNCFQDLWGIEPKEFTRQKREKKRKILREIYDAFRVMLWNDIKDFGLDGEKPDFELDWSLLSYLANMGQIAEILDDVTSYYSGKWKSWKWLKD